jgi:hypothetical protein
VGVSREKCGGDKGRHQAEEEFSRRILEQIDPRTDFAAYVQTAEDALLSKLAWFRQGGDKVAPRVANAKHGIS